MRLTTEGKIGIGLALVFGVGTGAVILAPDEAKPIGWTILALSVLGLILLVGHHGLDLWNRRHEPTERYKMLSFVGMVLFALGAIGFGVWHFWPSATAKPMATTTHPVPPPPQTTHPPIKPEIRAEEPTKVVKPRANERTTPLESKTSLTTLTDRSRYTAQLKAFVAEGVSLKGWLQAIDAPSVDKKIKEMWGWDTRVGMWICENMGEYALSKFADISSIQPRTVVASSPQASGAVLILEAQLSNIQAMIEHDTWDPQGKVVLPNNGCQAAVGRPNDAPTQGR